MNKQEWKDFKKYGIEHLWECDNNGWISALYDAKVFKIKNFLEKQIKKQYLKYFKFRYRLVSKPVIPVLEYVVTTKCTMNCKNCNTLVPYFTKDNHIKMINFEQFKQDLDKLLKSVDYINLFGFVGGEPLLNNDLNKMVSYACKQRKIKHVFIATNCTIIPNEKLLKALINKKVGVQISNYSHVENLPDGISVKHQEVKELLQKSGVKISNPHEPSGSKNWQTMPKIYADTQEEKEVVKNYNCCYGRFCYMLADGLILQCTACIYMTRSLELSDNIKKELINVRASQSPKELTGQLIKFLSKPYSQFCHYCHFVDMQYGLPCGEQLVMEDK